ncbi:MULTISPECIES: helix-turn-helix domain-containing protein [Paraburkholderia]|uniref:helix-turn-helix domain-containing protein n=1 Tax=Paraburkholderia TaxID=1822464 RepID=UPI00135BAB1A|nr:MULTISPECIES: helix-turn-helix transcriptional regulator [Paraburkholderia]
MQHSAASQPDPHGGRSSTFIVHSSFSRPSPTMVAAAITSGKYFLRAWREYREYKTQDAAELTGLSVKTILWHEQGYNVPGKKTLKRFADFYDCSLEQLMPASKQTGNKSGKVDRKARVTRMAPIDTDYPDTVLDHIRSGKAPVTAWRIHRCMTEGQLAERFGTSASLLQQMIERDRMSDRTLKKFVPIFHCTLDQLRRPEGLVVEPHKVRRVTLRRQIAGGLPIVSIA